MSGSGEPIYRMGDIEVDPSQGCLKRGDQEQYLRPKTFQVLMYLLEHRPRLVSKEELMERIWTDTAVTDDALVQCIVDIRKALGDDPHHPRFIKTLPKVGYRFIGSVEEMSLVEPAAIETEEFTSVEIEIEEEITNGRMGEWENGRMGDLPSVSPIRPLPHSPTPPFLPLRRRVMLTSTLVILAVILPLAIYLGHRLWSSHLPQAEVTLPQVPGKKALVVMYFENQSGSPDLNWLREGLADMLITDLSRSKKLTVLSRQQLHLLLERIGHGDADTIRLDEVLDIARRSQAEAMVLGSFAKLGEKVRLDVQLHDARTGQLLAAESIMVDRPDQILTQIDLLSLKLAGHLGVAPVDQDTKVGLAEVMTDNLEAYRYYSLAVGKAQAYHNAEAIELLEKAIALDPEFAMAYARIGYAYAVTWSFAEKGKPYLEKAFRLSDRLTTKDKLHITAWYAIAHLDYPSAIGTFREIIAQYPLEIEAYLILGRLLEGEEQSDEAINVLQQGLGMDPEAKDLYNMLGLIYSELGRHEEALAMHQRYVALAPEEPNAHDSLGLSYQWAGLYEQAMREYNRALELNLEFEIAVVHLGNVYFQLGRYREAITQYQRYIQVAPSDVERARLRLHRPRLLAKGRPGSS